MRPDLSQLLQLWRRLRSRLSKKWLAVCGAVAVALLALASAFGPIVRGQVARAAVKRKLDVTVGAVRPGWFSVRLRDVVVRLQGVPGISVHADEVCVRLTLGFGLAGLDLHGGQVGLSGKADQLQADLERWRGDRSEQAEGPGAGRVTPVSGDGFGLRWADGSPGEPRVELAGLAFSRDSHGVRVSLADGRLRFSRASLALAHATAELNPETMLERAHLGTLLVEWVPAVASANPAPPPPLLDLAPPAANPPASPIVATRIPPGRARASAAAVPSASSDPAAPFVKVPDWRALRRRAGALAAQLAARSVDGAEIGVDALTWKINQSGGDRVALTFGPGPVTATRTPSALELHYSTEVAGKARPDAATSSLSVRALVPTDGTDVAFTLEGGPVSLAMLGIQEGAAGLVDVSRATVAGRARVVLAADGGTLSFDAELGTRALSVNSARLSSDVVRGLDTELRARGVASATGEIRLDDFAATMGSLRLLGSGVLDQQPDYATATFRFEIPTATCQSLLSSIPSALLSALQGTQLGGTFGARGHFAFDSRTPNDLDLQYDVQDRCKMTQVPDALSPDRFRQSFVHRIYLPDGTTADELTGPGTSNWTALDDISPYMQVAVMTTEDGAFPRHRGFNHAAIRASIIANLKARRFVRGASTITMQLAKNLFLTREKTLGRKLEELVLTDYLEQTFTKDEILELYLNVIEFGPAVYGVTSAAEYYFGRTPAELNLAECLFLSSLLPAPLRYAAMRDGETPTEGWMRTLGTLMQVAHRNGLITDAELAEGQEETVSFWHGDERPPPRPPVHARVHLDGDDLETVPPFDLSGDTP
mgnify:CR=1 FL=1